MAAYSNRWRTVTVTVVFIFWLLAVLSLYFLLAPNQPALAWSALVIGLVMAGAFAAIAWPFLRWVKRLEHKAAAFAAAQMVAEEQASQLRSNDARSRAILRTMQDGVVHIDGQGMILVVNDAISRMFGYDEDELIGRNVSLLMEEPHRGAHDSHLARYRATRHRNVIGTRREVEGRRKDGSLFAIDLTINEMFDDSGNTFLGVIRDISDQKNAQNDLETALAAAQAAAEAKGEFLANMSHEIRTPINAVIGFADLCLRLDLSPRSRDYLDKIRTAAGSLLGIINDILDFSKIDAGKLQMESIPFSLGEVLHSVASLFGQKSRDKGIELVIGALPGIPDRLLGDPLRLGQVLTNLMGNALKFTERGEISLTVEPISPEGGTNDGATLRFVLRDTGLGMSPGQLATMFTAFTQADSSTTRRFGGTGLGLAISKQLVERMGGKITVESEEGKGSCFTFTARFGIAKGEAVNQSAARSPLLSKRVLVVDDSAVMRTLLQMSVEAFGCHAETAESGEDALSRIAGGDSFDLILLDWHLPGLDGLAVTRLLRDQGSTTPIILVTGDDPQDARTAANGIAIQAFLSKPVSRSTLYDTLASTLGGHAALPPMAPLQTPVPTLTGARILLVDDNDFNRQVGRELVELTSARVDTADDGAQAVSAIEAGNYDLVLMDLQMPVMDGYTAARTIRQTHPNLPILALTAHALIEEKERVLASGMNDMLTKPILPELLYSALVRWLERKSAPTRPPEAAPVITISSPPAVAAAATTADGFDLATALERVNGNRKLLERFLNLFRERNAGCVTEIETALKQQDLESARRLAHALKGGAGTVGAVDLQAAAAKLETTLTKAMQGVDECTNVSDDFIALDASWTRALATLSMLLDAPGGPQIQ